MWWRCSGARERERPREAEEHPLSDLLRKPLAELPDPLPIPHLTARGRAMFFARVRPPGSKSLTNRALLLAALARGESTVRGVLVGADDTERMVAGVRALGATVEIEGETARVRGVGGKWRITPGAEGGAVTLDCGNAGTAARFLGGAALLAGGGAVVIDGNARMRERPIAELVGALEDLGALVTYLGAQGCPPIRIEPPAELEPGALVELGTTASSQFVSALLLVGPWMPGGLTLRIEGEPTSRSYIVMTLGLLDLLGASVKTSEDLRVLRVNGAGKGLEGFDYTVEPDASSATYFWGAAALFPGAVARVDGIGAESLQGDAGFPEVLSRMGATLVQEGGEEPSVGVRGPASLAPVMADMSDMPDAAITLAVIAAFANGRSILRGLKTLRLKESDRIAALQAELAKVGVRVETNVLGDPDAITVSPPAAGIDCSANAPRVEFETYDDHRMAMGLALIGLRRPNIFVKNPACVRKTYPGFWGELAGLY